MDIRQLATQHRLLTAVFVGGIFYLVGQAVALEPAWLVSEPSGGEITVSGTGEVVAEPDIAKISFGVETGPLPSNDAALTSLSERMNRVIAVVQDHGVAEADIVTQNLSLNPDYDYNDGEETLRGFRANQTVRVTVRDLDIVGEIVAQVTEAGVNQFGGVQFSIDDPTALEQEAEEQAIAEAKERAEALAKKLGVRLGKLRSYQADSGGNAPIFFEARSDAAEPSAIPPPNIPAGSQDITATVTVTYGIR